MKRTLAMILAIVMVIGVFPATVFAAEEFKITLTSDVEDVSALDVGSKITVTANLENNPGFAGIVTNLVWDNTVVKFEGFNVRYSEDLEQDVMVSDLVKTATYNQETGTVVYGSEKNVTKAGGKLWEAVFTVLKGGETGIALNTDGQEFQMTNANLEKLTPVIDQTALAGLTVEHTCVHVETVVAPTCTEGGYTLHKCACGDEYRTANTPAAGHKYENNVCTVCGAPGTVIPEGAKFTDMLTDKGEIVTVTEKDGYYLVEVPYGTTSLMVTYPEELPKVDEFGYATTHMVGFDGVSQDGYGITRKDGKIIVGLVLEKAPSNGAPTVVRLINLDDQYGKKVAIRMADGSEETFALTYKLGNGQYFAVLPLPENCVGYSITGEAIASDGYSFNVSILEGYEATENFAVKVNGKTVSTEPGRISIPSVTEDLKVTVEGVGKVQNNTTDVIFNVDLTGAPEGMTGDIMIQDRNYNFIEEPVASGQMSTAAITAGNHEYTKLRVYGVDESLITGWEVNGTVYAAGGKQYVGDLTIWNRGYYLQVEYNGTTPITVNVKPVVEEVHIHDYESVVTPPTCTEGGYTTYTCKAGDDTYVAERVPALGHTNVNGTCSVCGAALTVIPEGATFLDMMTSDGKAVTVTDLGTDPFFGMGKLYKVEVPVGTIQVNITLDQSKVYVDEFGYAKTMMQGFDNVTEDGYGQTTKDGKVTVGLQMEKAPANGSSSTIRLLNVPYPEDVSEVKAVGLINAAYDGLDFYAFTYMLAEGQYYANLPDSFMYTVTGDGVASNGYKFNVSINNGYEATEDFAVRVNGEIVATQPGEVTVASVTEDLTITVEGVNKIYNPETDVSITVDLTEYTGEIEGQLFFDKKSGPSYTADLVPGKNNTIILEASDLWQMFATIYSIGSDVIGYDINGEIRDPGYLSFGFNVRDNAQPGKYVIKPIVGKVEEKEPNPITDIEISHPNIEVDETNGTMTMAMVTGASEQINVSTVLENAEQEATQVVAWSSSNPEVATVENGKVTALQPGTTVITAKAVDPSGVAAAAEGDEVLAQFTLTVADPAAGYAVNMGADKTVVANEAIQIPVTVTHSDPSVTDYKSFEFTFQYDPTVLTLKNESSAGEGKDITIVNENGTITVRRYGNALKVGDAAITLEFTAKKTGNTNVKLTSAKVGTSADAQGDNIPTAQVMDDITLITVTGYTVSLPEEFVGKTVVAPGEDYTFTAKDLNYEYTITATIGNQTLTVTGSGTDTDPYKITADQITGNIQITTEKSGKKFEITLNGASLAHNSGHTVVDGKTYAQYMTAYTAKLTKKDHYIYDLKVTVNNAEIEYTYDEATGIITIPGNLITGHVVIDSGEQESDKHDVTFEGTYASHAKYEGKSAVYDGENFSFTIETPEGFTIQSYEVSYKLGDATEYTALEAVEGTYTIENITAALTIKIEGTSDLKVEVNEYVKLNGKTVFLVTATQTLPEGKNLAYNSYVMYLKNFQVEGSDTMEQMYSYLVVVGPNETLSVEDATAMITIVEAQATTLADTFNVNESTALDINDAQLVYDLYNNVYQDIEIVGMQKFLRADVNGSRNINVSDAAAVVNAILAENQ